MRAGRARAKRSPASVPQVDAGALRALVADAAVEAHVVEVPVNRPPWTVIPIHAGEGDHLTWLAWGRVYLLRPLELGVPPHITLRGRVADGGVQQSSRDTFTFTADRSGRVELASLVLGEFREDGSVVTDRTPYRLITGGLTAVVARWAPDTDPREALEALVPRDPSGLCAAEARRLANPPSPPSGWEHHPLLFPEEVYSTSEAGIAADARETVSIIRRPADVPLTPSLRLRWSWRVDALPSELPEDTRLTHDYLSVALEFDDGQDLTWQWSCELPEGFAYRCPLDHWRHRETHIVVRSGTSDLGQWVDDERPVLADHQVAIGGQAPARVVRAWLISTSLFQRAVGRCEFGRIELVDGDQVVRVL